MVNEIVYGYVVKWSHMMLDHQQGRHLYKRALDFHIIMIQYIKLGLIFLDFLCKLYMSTDIVLVIEFWLPL